VKGVSGASARGRIICAGQKRVTNAIRIMSINRINITPPVVLEKKTPGDITGGFVEGNVSLKIMV